LQLILINTNEIIFKNNMYKARCISRNNINKTTRTEENWIVRKNELSKNLENIEEIYKIPKIGVQNTLKTNIEITNKINLINS
jgi:hypothetical protein